MISIAGYNKAEVLSVLYNACTPESVLTISPRHPLKITPDEAQEILEADGCTKKWRCLLGHVICIDLGNEELDTHEYNRYNGYLAAEKAITALKNKI